MRRVLVLTAVAAVLLTGCSLSKDDNCATEPGGVGGNGTAVCVKPPPSQFSPMTQ